MAFKPNYNQQRAERNRAKELKKQEKLQRREEEVAARRATDQPADGDAPESDGADDDVVSVADATVGAKTDNG
ncbi:hypothetical protein [Azospirillum sp.]|uniref:hypothetical protein n=1 Tax=Azospirillum sp. TaxID=34012 RepID=UPI00263776EE|nr:hypothetical protein [Azospirillum sp.]